jgi:hypothetical protein
MAKSSSLFLLFLLLLSLLFALPSGAQTRAGGFPTPPEPAEKSSTAADRPPAARRVRIDPVQLEREARELLELSQSLQLDIDRVNHGLLPKDTLQKLKRIEKLSKHLRSELLP